MKIIVTGGCGFIGSHVVETLLEEGNTVAVIDNLASGRTENLDGTRANRKLGVDLADVRTIHTLRGTFDKARPEAVIHLAAQPAISTSWTMPFLDAQTNILGTLNVIRLAMDYHVKKIVFASTSAVYEPKRWGGAIREDDALYPDSPYGASKMTAETYLRMMFPNYVILRLGNVFGPRQVPLGENQVIPRMIRHFLKGDDFRIHGDGKQRRDFVYVKDVAEAFVKALYNGRGTFNVATGKSVSIMELAREIEALYDVPGYAWEHDDTKDARRDVRLSAGAAARELAWKPRTSFAQGLRQTIGWWESQ